MQGFKWDERQPLIVVELVDNGVDLRWERKCWGIEIHSGGKEYGRELYSSLVFMAL